LIGDFTYLREENSELISRINHLSLLCEVYYLEGNHDFRLHNVFETITPIAIEHQPLMIGDIALSHGDNASDVKHQLFTTFIRSKIGLMFIQLVSLNFIKDRFLKKMVLFLSEKKICHPFHNFQNFVQNRVETHYKSAKTVIEGHYHQGVELKINSQLYLNLPSFACNESYIVVKFRQNELSFINKVFKG
jgi:UDP-2,3-diacylglucosamine hydrolase